MLCYSPIPILLRHLLLVVYREVFRKLTTAIGVFQLRKDQLTLQRSQTIHFVYESADRSQALCDLRLRPIQFLLQMQNVYVKKRPVGGQLVTLL